MRKITAEELKRKFERIVCKNIYIYIYILYIYIQRNNPKDKKLSKRSEENKKPEIGVTAKRKLRVETKKRIEKKEN